MDLNEAINKGNKLKPPCCAVEGCENKGFILLQGQFVCGDCVTRFEEWKQKQFNIIMGNISGDKSGKKE